MENENKNEETKKIEIQENKKTNTSVVIIIIIAILLVPIIFLVVGVLNFNFIAKNDIEKITEKIESKNQEVEPKIYILKANEYYLSNEGPEIEEITIKDYEGNFKKVKKLNIENGIYDVEVLKGDNVRVKFGVGSKEYKSIGFTLSFNDNIKKYEDMYIDNGNPELKEIPNESDFSNLSVASFVVAGINGNDSYYDYESDVEVKLTKLNTKVNELPQIDENAKKVVLKEDKIGLYGKYYEVGKDLEPGIYTVICKEGKTLKPVLEVDLANEEKATFIRIISESPEFIEGRIIRTLKLSVGDKLTFGAVAMGVEVETEEELEEVKKEIVSQKPLVLEFIKK